MATILIVDDRLTNREYLATLLGYGGHRLLQAIDGAEALATARAERPDLIIADILMPTMDGYEFVRQLRTDSAIAATPVIFFTAHYHEREARALANACGVSHILTKPAEPDVVLRTVDAALGVSQGPAPGPPAEEFDRDHLRLLTDKLSRNVDELRTANQRMTALVDLGLELGSERDPKKLLQTFCHAAREIIGAKYAIAGILAGDGPELRYFFTSGMDAETATRLGTPDPRRGGPGSVLRDKRCLRLHNPAGAPAAIDFPSSYPPLHSWLGAPIVSPGHIYGWLGLLNKVGAAVFSDEDERLAGILAAQVGRIYENGSLYADLLRQAAELEQQVAERKRSEEALRESEERFRGAFEHTGVATVLIDIDNRFTQVNAAFARMFGYSQAEMFGMSMADLTHPDDLAESYAGREALLAGKEQFFQMEKRFHHRDGRVLWGLTSVTLVRDPSGRPRLYVGQVQDITERKLAEETSAKYIERLRILRQIDRALIAGEGPAAIAAAALTPLRELLGVPRAIVNLFDLANGEVEWLAAAGRRRVHVGPGVRFSIRFMGDVEALRRGELQLIDVDALPPGPEVDALLASGVHAYIVVPMIAEGELIGALSFGGESVPLTIEQLGIAEEAATQFAIALTHARLHERVKRQAQELEIQDTERKQLEEQFRQAQKMEALGRLAGGVAHDFNNLLTVINGYGELVLDKLPAGDSTRELIQEVVAAGNRATGLTRQLLAFSRKAILEPKVLNLTEVIADVDNMLRRIIGEDIQLSVVADPELGAVKVDHGEIEQVVMNLVINARDAMPQGGRLTIELHNIVLDEIYTRGHLEVRPGRHVLIAVTDTGCGMDQATLSRIFEPFFSTKGEMGTGLGLATVHGIVKQSGGHVAVYSEVGHGTTFKVYLPRVEQRPSSGKSHPGLAAMPRGSETLLLVEDEDGVRALSRHVLAGLGYIVLEARDGAEAVRIAGQHGVRIDLMLTDVVMPRMGGREAAGRVVGMHPGAKVLFLSGYTDDAVVRHGILQAKVAFLQKPFTPASLAMKVRDVLDGEREGKP